MQKIIVFMIALGALNQVAQAGLIKFGKCPVVPVIPDFDAAKYLGKWYEIERSNIPFEKNLDCVKAEYGPINSTVISVNNTGLYKESGKTSGIVGYAYVPNVSEPNKLLVVFPTTPFPGNYNVYDIGGQYETSIVYSCTQVLLFKVEMIWILSRTQTLPDSVVTELKNKLKAAEIDISDFEKTDQTNC